MPEHPDTLILFAGVKPALAQLMQDFFSFSALPLKCCHSFQYSLEGYKKQEKILKYKPPVRDAHLRTQRTQRIRRKINRLFLCALCDLCGKKSFWVAGFVPALVLTET